MITIKFILPSLLVMILSSALHASDELTTKLTIQQLFVEWYRVELQQLEKQVADACLATHFNKPTLLSSNEYNTVQALLHKRLQYYQAQSVELDIQQKMCDISLYPDNNLANQLMIISIKSQSLAALCKRLEIDYKNIRPYSESCSNE